MHLIDIGANLTHESFQPDFDAVMERAHDAGIVQMMVTGASRIGSAEALAVARRSPGRLFATAGIHPHHAEETSHEAIEELRTLAGAEEVRAIGETGLDFFRDFCPRETQVKSFEAHIELAVETGLPMFLHERDAWPTFADVISAHRDRLGKLVVHCFTGEIEALDAYLAMDCYIGITGWVCDERRGTHLLPLLERIPEDRLMIETDAPYLMPRNIRPRPKTRRNEPHNLPYICQFVADVLGVSFDELATRTTSNARHFFELPNAG